MANLFRGKSLQKLSSPEQLDKLIVINSPLVFIALLGGAFIIISVLVWSILGRVPITEDGQGILLNNENLTSVYSKTMGVVTKSYISCGDQVKKGDVLYEVKSEETSEASSQLKERLSKVDNVTLDSEFDEVTTDNQPLLDIKEQLNALKAGSDLNVINIFELESQCAEKEKELRQKEVLMKKARKTYYNAIALDNGSKIEYEYTISASEYQTAESAYTAAVNEYEKLSVEVQTYKAKYEEYAELAKKNTPEAAEYTQKANEYKKYYDEANTLLSEYSKTAAKQKDNRDKKKSLYKSKKKEYEKYINNKAKRSQNATKYLNNFNNAMSVYAGVKAEVDSYRTQIMAMESQGKTEAKSQTIKIQTIEAQFNNSKQAIVDGLNREIYNYELLQEGSEIRSTVDGTVYSTFAANGSTLTIDSEVARISTQSTDKLYAIYYLSIDSGKNVKEGMKINIYPRNVAKEEYGHMSGTVISVADYVTSYADLFTKLGDDSLISTFSKVGSVIEVTCEIDRDDNTISGFAWSSEKGRNLELSGGTMLLGSIITENVAPITMFVPKLKETFHLE